jgi:sterol desaturase/sphingolipid hydroxylase (fatty acid hydroxylase superfamily)
LIRFGSTGLGFAAAVVTLWLVTDLFEYLFHRIQHAVPWMWAMHELHHSEETYNVTLTYRHYWFEFVLKGLFVYPIVGILLKVPPSAAGLVALMFLVNHVVAHMNVPLSLGPLWAWISTPQFHRLHHSRDPRHYDKNFCDMLPLWDVLFGTALKPEPGEFCEIGLMPSHKPATLWQALSWPFARRSARNCEPAVQADLSTQSPKI